MGNEMAGEWRSFVGGALWADKTSSSAWLRFQLNKAQLHPPAGKLMDPRHKGIEGKEQARIESFPRHYPQDNEEHKPSASTSSLRQQLPGPYHFCPAPVAILSPLPSG